MGYATLGRRREDCRFMIVDFRVKGFRFRVSGKKNKRKAPRDCARDRQDRWGMEHRVRHLVPCILYPVP